MKWSLSYAHISQYTTSYKRFFFHLCFTIFYLMKSTKDHMGHWHVNKNRLDEYE